MRSRRRRTLGALVATALVVVIGLTISGIDHAVHELALPLATRA